MKSDHVFGSVDQAVTAASRQTPDRPAMLERLADAIDQGREQIIRTASEESALTPAELAPEFERTTGTLRMFAEVVRDGAWVRAAINPAPGAGEACIGPRHDLRRMLLPLGEVVGVFGASNFPLAYGVFGGDTASALAAGCGVVVKEHPAHPRTGRLLASIAADAPVTYVTQTDPGDHTVAGTLVAHPRVCAVGFTGSVAGGLAIDAMARARSAPIPVFAEMGSANSVVVTPGAARDNGREIGVMIGESMMARHGQQCTKPGLVFVPRGAADVIAAMSSIVQRSPGRDMLAPWVRESFVKRVRACEAARGVTPIVPLLEPKGARDGTPALLLVSLRDWIAQPVLHEEIFGPAGIVIEYDDVEAVLAASIPNALALTLHAALPHELEMVRRLATHLSARAGRFIFGGVPTGVRVADAMVHGGPYSATNRPESTAVGPRAMERWCRPVCYQGVPGVLLPQVLRA